MPNRSRGAAPRRRMPPTGPAALAHQMGAGCLCFRARRTARAITRLYDDALRPTGLQATQLTLLNAIAAAGPHGQRLPRLADVLALDATTLSRNLRPLARAGLVRLVPLPSDRRARTALLTPAGARRIAEAYPLWCAAHARVVEMLGTRLSGELGGTLDRATSAIAAARPAAPATRSPEEVSA